MSIDSRMYSSSEPTYNLKAVVQETGLKADTLRAWERRYGLPEPKRTPNGHRIYSDRDIATLKWLIARQEQGLSISRAVALWQSLAEQGISPIGAREHELETLDEAPLEQADSAMFLFAPKRAEVSDQHIDHLRREWVRMCLAYNEQAAEDILSNAFSLFDTEYVCCELLLKAMVDIGQAWDEGKLTVQQEHFASSLALRRLHALHTGTPVPTISRRVFIGCPTGEEHILPVLLLSLLLRRRGWNTVFLGSNIPLAHFGDTLQTLQPDMVVLSAQQLHTVPTLLDMGRLLHEYDVPLAFDGLVFARSAELRRSIPGHYLGGEISQAPSVIQQILDSPGERLITPEMPQGCQAGWKLFRENKAQIEAIIWQKFAKFNVDPQAMEEVNDFMGKNIAAALALSWTRDIDAELDRIGLTLRNHLNLPSHVFSPYLTTYRLLINKYVQSEGQIIADWIDRLLSSHTKNSIGKNLPPAGEAISH